MNYDAIIGLGADRLTAAVALAQSGIDAAKAVLNF